MFESLEAMFPKELLIALVPVFSIVFIAILIRIGIDIIEDLLTSFFRSSLGKLVLLGSLGVVLFNVWLV